MNDLTEAEIAALRELLETAEGLAALKVLIPYTTHLEKKGEVRKSWGVLKDSYGSTIIFLASIIGALIFLRDQAKSALQGWLGS